MVDEVRVVRTNSLQRRPNGAGDIDPRSLGLRRGAPVPPAETEGAGELRSEELHLLADLLQPTRVRPRARLREVVLELPESGPVVGLCPRVEDRTGVGQDGRDGIAVLAADQIEHVELAAGGTKEDGEVVQALAVLQSELVTVETDRPVLALPAQHGGARRSRR